MQTQHVMKEKLLGLKSELLNKSQQFRQEHPETRTNRGDEADQASNEINLNLSLQLQERDRLLVQKIDYALSKINQGNFGECDDCGAEIEEKRLAARPYTNMCITCKEEQEHRRRMHA